MIPRRAVVAGIKTRIGNHIFRANRMPAVTAAAAVVSRAQTPERKSNIVFSMADDALLAWR